VEYFSQLAAEKRVTRYVKGFPRREWVKVRSRNEALDCRVYAMAAMVILNPAFEVLAKRLAVPPSQKPKKRKEPVRIKLRRPGRPWP
jgi:phage terminase large subunit GpA-like protein